MTLTPDRRRGKRKDRRTRPASPSCAPRAAGGGAGSSGAATLGGSATFDEGALESSGLDPAEHPGIGGGVDQGDPASAKDSILSKDPALTEGAAPSEAAPLSEGSALSDGATPESPASSADSAPEPKPKLNWKATPDDEEAQAALRRRAAEIDAEQEAWMRQKREERERAEQAKRDAAAAADPEWANLGVYPGVGLGDVEAKSDGDLVESSEPDYSITDEDRAWFAEKNRQTNEFIAHKQNELIERQRRVLGGLGPGPSDGEVGSGFASEPPWFTPREQSSRGFRAGIDRVAAGWPGEDHVYGSDRPTNDEAADGATHLGENPESGPRAERSDSAGSGPATAGPSVAPADSDSGTADAGVTPAGSESDSGTACPYPLLPAAAWTDLAAMAPELTGSIENLRTLVDELESFERPMGPDEAVTMLDGIETLNRLTEALSVVTLSVFGRVGTPRDYGAKSTRDLVKNRLGVSVREAARRVDLADQLGKRVTVAGESLEPEHPIVADALRTGTLSSVQVGIITRFLEKLPRRVTEDQRLEAERILVEKAPEVDVRDIRVLFDEILKWLDPDGEQPDESTPREDFRVNLRDRKDGTWDLKGRLDSVTGGIMHGLLTSRMQTDEAMSAEGAVREDRGAQTEAGRKGDASSSEAGPSDEAGLAAPGDSPAGSGPDSAVDEAVRLFEDVLRGDRYDALDPTPMLAPVGAAPTDAQGNEIPAGYGVREDGTPVPMDSEQPSVRNRIYERFSTIIGRIEMGRVGAGAPFALVVTAKAEDIANGSGQATTGAAERFPISAAVREGLNGAVFFHLMSEKGRTVSVQTENRYANRNQLTILAARDQGCTFPGCETPPGWCDAHHIVPWSEKGRTEINNLTLACSAHHHLIDKSDWHTIMLKDGRPAWVPPATIDPERRPILHSRFIAGEIADTLFG